MNDEWIPVPKPPLGKPRDTRQEEADALERVGYTLVENFPGLELVVRQSSQYINKLRQLYGLRPMSISNSDIRLIGPSLYEQDIPLTEEDRTRQYGYSVNMSKEGENGAFFEPVNRLCFIRFDPVVDVANQHQKVKTAYIIAHELGHKAMDEDGVLDYSSHLNEGFAELIARAIMRGVTSKILSESDYAESIAMIEYSTPYEDSEGRLYMNRDVLLCMPDGNIIEYCGVHQMQLLESMARTHPGAYHFLFRSALSGNPTAAREIIETCFGERVAQGLTEKDLPAQTLVDLFK